MMRFAVIHCPSPNCRAAYEAMVEAGLHAECPKCHQVNRVPSKDMSKELTGYCDRCGFILDEHIYGRESYCCPPRKEYSR